MRFYPIMKGQADIPRKDSPPPSISWTDALILAGAVFGILVGVSFLSFEVAAAVGVLMLAFVVVKLLTTKP